VWLGGQRAGEIATLATRGLDGLDSYFARYLPQLVLAVVVPIAVLIRVAAADWISAVVIAVTLPLIPVFAVLVAFLPALVLELAAALATALVAVEVGLRLLYGHLGYETALLVLLLT